MRPRIDGKIRAQMWSVTRASVLSALCLIACKEQPVEPADCPDTTTELGGVCRTKCTANDQCLLTELCERGACMPEPITEMPRIKVLTVDPVPVERGASVAIDFGAVSTDYVYLEVLWDDGSSMTLHDSTIEHFGTKTITGVQQPGTVRFTARKNGVDVSAQASIRLEDGLPRIDYFTVEPQRVDPGQTVAISWRVSNQTEPIQISIENGAVLAADAQAEGTIMYDVLQPTTFILTSGTLFARAKVEVNAVGVDPQILRFEMRGPDPALYDHPIAVIWQTSNAAGATLLIDGSPLFPITSPEELDNGALPLVLPAGAHTVQLEVVGNGTTVRSHELLLRFLTDQPPQIGRFDYTRFAQQNQGSDIQVQWSILAPDLDYTFAQLGWSDSGTMPVPFDGGEARPPPGVTVTALLFAESPVGIAEARGTTFAVTQEIEPNDDLQTATAMNLFAFDGTTSALDSDLYTVGTVAEGQTVVAAIDGACPLGMTLSLGDDSGMGSTYIAGADGDCPVITYTAQMPARVSLAVSITGADVTFGVQYRLSADILDPICGDGLTHGQEQCDLGDRANGDGCSAICQNEDLISYDVTGGVGLPAEPRPLDARRIDFHQYPNGGGIPAENGFGSIEIPNGFPFFERTYHALLIHADGYVSFVPDFFGAFDPTRPLESSSPNEVIALFGADLRPSLMGGVYAWISTAGGVVIEYDGFVREGSPTSRLSGRIILEPDGAIYLEYLTLDGVAPEDSFEAGLQDRRGNRTLQLGNEISAGVAYEIRGSSR